LLRFGGTRADIGIDLYSPPPYVSPRFARFNVTVNF
jgi:hypothetical protein